MRSTVLVAIVTWVSLAIGNFVYQSLGDRHDWATAIERSWFQAWALAVFLLILWRWQEAA